MQNTEQTILYANIARRVASLFLDFIISDILFIIILYLIDKVYTIDVFSKIANNYLQTTKATTSISSGNTLLGEIAIGFIFIFAAYSFTCLLAFGRTAGMQVFNISYVTADSAGNPRQLSFIQKFSRGVICSALTLLFAFIPAIVWPFDTYKRNINDLISGTFVIQKDNKQTKTIGAYLFLFILVCLYMYAIGVI